MQQVGSYLRVILCRNNILLKLLGREVPVAFRRHDSEDAMIGDSSIIKGRRIELIGKRYSFRFVSLSSLGRYRLKCFMRLVLLPCVGLEIFLNL